MKRLGDLAKDTFTYGAANIVSQTIGFFLLPLYTTYLSPTDYGVIAMLGYVSIFFTPIAALGMTNAIFRRYNLHRESSNQEVVLSTGLFFVSCTSLLLFSIGVINATSVESLLVGNNSDGEFLRIVLITSFLASIESVFVAVLRAKRLVTKVAFAKILHVLVAVGCTIYFVVFRERGVIGVLYGQLIGAITSFITQLIFSVRYIVPRISLQELVALLNYGAPYMPHRLISRGSQFVGIFLIKEFAGLGEAGLYDIATKFAIPLTFLVGSVQSAWVPIKFQIHRDEEDRGSVFRNLISFYFFTITIVFCVLVSVGPEILRLMTNIEFHDSSFLLPLVLMIPFIRGVYVMSGTGFEFTNNTKPIPLISLSGLITLVVFAYLSVNFTQFGTYGIIGSIISSWLVMSLIVRSLAIKRFFVPINSKFVLSLVILVTSSALAFVNVQMLSPLNRYGIIIGFLVITIVMAMFVLFTNKDLVSLNLKKYPLFGAIGSAIENSRLLKNLKAWS